MGKDLKAAAKVDHCSAPALYRSRLTLSFDTAERLKHLLCNLKFSNLTTARPDRLEGLFRSKNQCC
jgi:hypothetical protein